MENKLNGCAESSRLTSALAEKPKTKITKTVITKKSGEWEVDKEGKKTYWSDKFSLEEIEKNVLGKKKEEFNVW